MPADLQAGRGARRRHGTPGVLVVRHGESSWNAARRWQGWADPPLSQAGRRQARRAGDSLRRLGLDAVHASDLARARTTAEILADRLGLGPPRLDPGLRERDVGEWTGLGDEEIEARWPGPLDAWNRWSLDAAPGGETTGCVFERVSAALVEIVSSGPHRRLLVVSHSGALRALERSLGLAGDPVAHLAGRWFHVHAGVLRPGLRLSAATSSGHPPHGTRL